MKFFEKCKKFFIPKSFSKNLEYAGIFQRFAVVIIDSFFAILLIPIPFTIYFYFRDGQTLGQKILGTRIGAENGDVASWRQLAMRYPLKFISLFPVPYFPIGFLWAIIDKRKRTWHDFFANSVVIKTKDSKPIVNAILIIIFLITISFAAMKSTQFYPTGEYQTPALIKEHETSKEMLKEVYEKKIK